MDHLDERICSSRDFIGLLVEINTQQPLQYYAKG